MLKIPKADSPSVIPMQQTASVASSVERIASFGTAFKVEKTDSGYMVIDPQIGEATDFDYYRKMAQ